MLDVGENKAWMIVCCVGEVVMTESVMDLNDWLICGWSEKQRCDERYHKAKAKANRVQHSTAVARPLRPFRRCWLLLSGSTKLNQRLRLA